MSPTEVAFPMSAFPPLAVGFFGLGTGYLIYGPQELLKFPRRNRSVDISTGIWGIWMPGFMQFLTGIYLFVGLSWFHSFRAPPLYMAALAFTAYGVHWFAIGLGRAFGANPTPNAFMSIAFTIISVIGLIVFFHTGDAPVGGLFIGLTAIYVSDFFASISGQATEDQTGLLRISALAERMLGFFHIGTGLWLMYLTLAVSLNFSAGYHLLV